jgi:tRNA A37 methylthiotransferase MiaB
LLTAYSVYMWNYDQVADSLKRVREQFPNVRTVFGGPLVTYTPDEVMSEHPDVDIVVRGNGGEIRFKQLLKGDFSPAALREIPQISFRDEDGALVHTQGEVKEDVSQIPSIYETGVLDLNDGNKHTVFIETFRGCPFSCGYCIWGPEESAIYKFDLDQLCRDIDTIYNNPNVRAVIFTDACLFYTKKRAHVICDHIAKAKYKIPTIFTLDVHVMDEAMCESLSKVNLYHNQWHFGIQTTNPKALDLLKRPGGGEPEKYLHKVDLLRDYIPDAEISFDLIYGLPGDDYAGFRASTDFVLGLRPGKVHFSPLLLLPGTRFFDQRDQLGFVYDDQPPYMVRANESFPPDEIRKAEDLVLWVMAALYFPAIRDALYELCSRNGLGHIDVIEDWVERLSKKIDPVSEVKLDFTIEAQNLARRSVMNILTQPENAVLCYETMFEVMQANNAVDLADDIRLGIDYYKAVGEGKLAPGSSTEFEDARQLVDQGVFSVKDVNKINRVKTVWVTAA